MTEMDEYIEREEIRRAYEKLTRSYVNGDPYIAGWRFDEMIESLPAANVAPVRHGGWLSWDELHGGNTHAKNVLGVFCSECIRQSDSKTHFCPNCGAKMDGGINK